MGDDNEFMKLSTEDKCVHKLWKARVAGYEEAIKLFNQIDDEKSPEWSKYLGLIKKFVTDSNAVAQEKGLEAALVFVENCGHAGKTTGEVMSGIVTKCIAAPRTKTKDLALQVTLMYVEIEKQDIVQEELMKGMEHKNPKIVAACISATTTALRQFGNKVFSIKPLVKKIPITLADRDKDVRAEGKALVVEMHRWIGPAIEPHIATLQAVVQQELRDAFSAVGSAQPTRWLKSQQARQAEIAAQVDDDCDGGVEEDDSTAGAGDSADVDPYDLMEPVEILSKLPKDFYDKLEAKKWQERKEALDSLENLLKNAMRLETGDYADLVRALKKMISKDSNVMLVALSGRLLGSVASGLRNKFQPYAVSCVSAILEKFKEKKVNVVTALREAIDAIYPCTNLEAIMEDVIEALNNKNPSVKAETSLFLARAFCRTQPAALNKKMLKAYVGGLLKLLESADPTVRDASAEALGTAMKLVSEKNIAPHIGKLDNLKEQKIKEFCDKAVITVKVAGPKKDGRPKSAPAAKESAAKAGSTQPKPVKRPTTGVRKAAPGKKATAGASKAGAGGKAGSSTPAVHREQELSQEEVDERADELFSPEVIAGLADTNWKTRLSSIQAFTNTVQGLSPGDASSQVLLRALNKKPGLKDTNFQVLKCRLEVVKLIAQSFTISATSVDFIIQDVVEKLGDVKCSSVASDALTALAEATKLEHVGLGALEYAMDKQKNPKVQAEVYNWLANAIREFGFSMNIKSVIAHCKKGVAATNPAVRTSCVAFLGVLSLYAGPGIIQHFDGEKPALKQQIMTELDKYANDKAPSPIRGLISKSASKASMGEDLDDESANDYGDDDVTPAAIQDTVTRTDISPLITDSLISEINDKNWKVRNEGLDKLRAVIASSSPIKSTLGELPPALASRLMDSNSKIAQTALQIAESLATAMGPKCKTHVRAFFPGFFLALGDSKQWIRSAAVQCLGTWCVQAGGAQVALDGEMVYDTLKAGSPALKAELLQWLAEYLPEVPNKSFPKEELSVCLPILYAAVEDRNADVRKNAGEAVFGFMLHLGYEAMHKQLEKLKPASKPVVLAALDKARPNLPVQPLPSAKGKPDAKTVKSGGAQKKEAEKKSGNVQKVKGIVKPSSATGRSKKEDEEALMPLMPNNNAKNQRIIDDQKLKVLKWNFTQPREEFFDLLKDQMTSAGLNKQLIANMFHADFRYHLKALESLMEDLPENGSALMANLDLVLKWLTLRFFDTNPSVILKGLEYLSAVFNYLISEEYTLAEYEANCFIPYLVLKVGDPKDSVRNGVKALFKQICIVYSVTKLFGYLMEGLKSKNARQRSECMECICLLLECYGSSVCAPSPAVALRELARHIGDRDNAVRSAALNCVAQAYFLEGEKVYKMIGQISDKDQSLLEERIKRAAKSRSAENRKSALLPLTSSGKQLVRQPSDPCIEESEQRVPDNQISVDAVPGAYEDRSPEPEPTIPAIRPQQAAVLNGPFGLDPELIAKLDAMKPSYPKHETPEIDIQFLDDAVTVATVRPSIAVAGMKANMLPMSPPSIMSSAVRPPASFLGPPSLQPEDNLLTHFIHSIASPNLNVATTAMSHIKEVAMSGRGAALRPHEEQLLRAAATQVRQLRLAPSSPDVHAAFKYIMAMLTALYEGKEACGGSGEAGSVVLAQLVSELLRVLAARTLETATDASRLVRALNYVCVRVLDGSDHTNLLCALMTLLHESIGGDMRYQELLMKCLWKVLKMIPNWEPGSMDYDALMYRIHLFYMAYPNSYWKKNTEMNDTPCRTVKTLVHSLVKIKGSAIMNHLTQIPDATETELYAYLLKLFKQLKLEERKENVEVNGGGGVKMSRAVHDELGHILKRISEKGTSRDALVQLYELRERHPAIDIWTYMRGSSLHFRSYIERGLREVAEERRGGATLHQVAAGVYSSLAVNAANVAAQAEGKDDPNDQEGGEKHYTYFLERLRALQTQAGLRNEAPPGSQPRTPVIDNKTMVDSFSADPVRTHNIDPQFDLHPSQPLSQRNEAGVDALRQKLQQIKSSSKR